MLRSALRHALLHVLLTGSRMQAALAKEKELRQAERTGRIRAERALAAQQQAPPHPAQSNSDGMPPCFEVASGGQSDSMQEQIPATGSSGEAMLVDGAVERRQQKSSCAQQQHDTFSMQCQACGYVESLFSQRCDAAQCFLSVAHSTAAMSGLATVVAQCACATRSCCCRRSSWPPCHTRGSRFWRCASLLFHRYMSMPAGMARRDNHSWSNQLWLECSCCHTFRNQYWMGCSTSVTAG